jgi:hypothetical protein
VQDSTNPIVSATAAGAYTGCAWVDVDDDGLQDLFIVRRSVIYHNLGGGLFERQGGATAITAQGGNAVGTTWSDYDNDGDIDCYLSGGPWALGGQGSMLYRNDGGYSFTRIDTGDVGNWLANVGWGSAFGDIDNDGYTDIVVAAANGFSGVTIPNSLLMNNGDGTFTKDFSSPVTDTLDAYTVATFSDYDMDGDVDLFIGSGEISRLDPDNLYRNLLVENGSWAFEKITTAPIATDSVQGQVWNWVDYDNDGDLDGFQTNYGAPANNLYRNDSGSYVRMTGGDVGTIVTDSNSALANVWGDFDNDGDLDCLVTNDGGATNDYFVNNGDGTFTQDLASALAADGGPHYGAAIADYDLDGDLDLYVHGNTNTKELFRNDLSNGNHWVEIKLVGAGAPGGSNVSALGARVRAKATIGGTPTWQMREVSAQNSFNSMNMLDLHFGLGDAAVIDSLEVTWPAGGVQVFTGVAADRHYRFTEGADPTGAELGAASAAGVRLLPSRPNPFAGATVVAFYLPRAEDVRVRVFDLAGREIRTLFEGRAEAGRHALDWDGRDARGSATAAGVYFVKLQGSGGADLSQKVVRLR